MSALFEVSFDHIKTNCFSLDVMRKEKIFSDVRFVVDNKVFEAHKNILAAASPVFLAMFKSGMKEALSSEVVLTETDPDVFEDFLRFVYCGRVTNMDNALPLLDLADKYHILSLFDICLAHLKDTLNEINVCERLQLACLRGASSLKIACLELIRDNFELVSSSSGWDNIAKDLQMTTLIAQHLPSLPVEKIQPTEFNEISEGALCYSDVETVQWSIKWAAVLNRELLGVSSSLILLERRQFRVPLMDDKSQIKYCDSFYLYLTTNEIKKYGTKVTFWLTSDSPEIGTMNCLAVLHSSVPAYEYRRCLTISFEGEAHQCKKILSFLMSGDHFSIDNSIKLSLTFVVPGTCTLLHDEWNEGPHKFAKIARTNGFADVTFDLNGTHFHAHRIILSCRSGFFKELFQTNPQSVYSFKETDPETFDALLNFMYHCEYPERQLITIDLLQTAAEFGAVDLVSFCSLIIAENVTVSNAIRLLKISQYRGAEKLKTTVIKFIGHNMSEVIASAGWQNLDNCSSTVTELFLGLSRLRASENTKRIDPLDCDISYHFVPEIFEKDV